MSAIQIDISDKSYQYDGHTVRTISKLQLQVNANEFVCLVGPSGCGKTTLLNIVAGLDSQFHGHITINHDGPKPHLGYVFQSPRLLPWYTVRKNIELVLCGLPPAELIDSLLAEMQLTEVQHFYPERLSLGMQRRVAIIRAFAINPDVLLMDEPFVSLDAPSARQIRTLLYSLWLQRPHTVLFVTHDLREAIALADRLIFLTPKPMQIVADIPVGIARMERNDAGKIEAFREHLLQDFPIINRFL
jgi:NitT/TauT family transport system ATP-binding protein